MEKVEKKVGVKKIIIVVLIIISISFYVVKCGLCSEDFNRDAGQYAETEMLNPHPDDYA